MDDENRTGANKKTHDIWNVNAQFWDERMGEGNDFVEILIWPATVRLLDIKPGERVLDIACGNGLTSRKLARMGAKVKAFDFSEEMIRIARSRHEESGEAIEYSVLDATNEDALLALGHGRFDAAICNMALFDMAEIKPLFRSLAKLLRPGGRFVFSVLHPCFNNPLSVQTLEMEDRLGEAITTYSIKVRQYMTESVTRSTGITGQPEPHLFFHRPLCELLGAGFEAGFSLDGLEERAFPACFETGSFPLSWSGHFSEIPPVLVARMRTGN